MNIWRRGPLNRNPYYRTAFRVAGVSRETVRHRTIVQRISQTRRVVRTDPQQHTVNNEPVTDAEINAAEQILLDPKKRILEELIHHAAEKPPIDRLRRLAQEVAKLMGGGEEGESAFTNPEWLRCWAQSLVQQFLDEAPGPDPSLGAPELEIVPPVGHPEGG